MATVFVVLDLVVGLHAEPVRDRPAPSASCIERHRSGASLTTSAVSACATNVPVLASRLCELHLRAERLLGRLKKSASLSPQLPHTMFPLHQRTEDWCALHLRESYTHAQSHVLSYISRERPECTTPGLCESGEPGPHVPAGALPLRSDQHYERPVQARRCPAY